MIRKLLQLGLKITEKGSRFEKLRPLAEATDSFFFKPNLKTLFAPHIRDSVDIKRWMMIVIFALTPCILMAIWNTGVQNLVYTSSSYELMDEFLQSSSTFKGYFSFCFRQSRYLTILALGLGSFLPIMLVSYVVGGFWEILFACIRGHEINEGLIVSAMLFPLTLPSTTPLWMVGLGVSFGIVIGKELFGGTGMNILNPALTCRAFLFFSFPGRMTGEVWAGSSPVQAASSIAAMNFEAGVDAYSQSTALAIFNVAEEVKRIHIDTIGMYLMHIKTASFDAILIAFNRWKSMFDFKGAFEDLNIDQLKSFVTSENGLDLPSDYFTGAMGFAKFKWGLSELTNGNLFFGNRLGSMGETSILASLFGAFVLIYTKVGSWKTMFSVILGGLFMATLFQLSSHLGFDHGIYNPAKFDFPVYKQLLMGSLVFGAVFFATDPVSSPTFNLGRYINGFAIGCLIIIIRLVNPAFPEGVALAIIFMNVFVPLIDHLNIKFLRRKKRVRISA